MFVCHWLRQCRVYWNPITTWALATSSGTQDVADPGRPADDQGVIGNRAVRTRAGFFVSVQAKNREPPTYSI